MKTFVIMLLMIWNNETGEPVAVFEPLPIFTSMEKCLEVSKTAIPPPDGFSATIQCVEAQAPIIKDGVTIVDE